MWAEHENHLLSGWQVLPLNNDFGSINPVVVSLTFRQILPIVFLRIDLKEEKSK